MKISELFDVEGLITVVTGGASGIGYACAEAMVVNGAVVTLMDVDPTSLARAVETLVARAPAGAKAVHSEVVDVTDRPGLREAFDRVAKKFGRLDVTFANAGITGGPGFLDLERQRVADRTIESITDDHIDRVVRTNYLSIFATIQAAVPHMKASGGGRIIVTSSISTIMAEVFVSPAYVMSKAGLTQLVRQAALELAEYNILVNAMAPSPVATNIAGGRLKDPEAQKIFAKGSPMHRIGQPDDMQGLALFLASPASSYITGVQILIDGGMSLGSPD